VAVDTTPGPQLDEVASVPRRLLFLMATASGLAVASNYYVQALLPDMRNDLGLSAGLAALLISTAQIGYGVGLLAVLPLGDLLERRRLVTVLMALTATGLAAIGIARSPAALLAAIFFVGTTTVVAQVLTVFAAGLVPDRVRGRVVGAVMSGFSAGILLARTVSGLLAEVIGWRWVYGAVAVLMLGVTLALRAALPVARPNTPMRYGALLRSTGRLLLDEPVLRMRAVYCSSSFAAFSMLWASIALLLSAPPFDFSTGQIGLIGLIGAVGLFASPVVGWLSDRGAAPAATRVGAALLTLSWLPLALGKHSLGWLIVGVAGLCGGHQCLMVASFGEIYRIRPEARSRMNAALMVTYFVAGATASTVAAAVYPAFGWHGVCLAGAAAAAVSLVLSIVERRPVKDPATSR
jgi:predicted MFS family arabinose efflux permease